MGLFTCFYAVLVTEATRNAASLDRIINALGGSLLSVAAAPQARQSDSQVVRAVTIHDPHDPGGWPADTMLLAVAISGTAAVARLLREAGAHQATAVVVKAPLEVDEQLREAVTSSGVAVLELARDASWIHLADAVRALVSDEGSGAVSGDLFSVANAVSALFDAPVALEDRSFRVLAWSARQDEADTARVEAILGRQAPSWIVEALQARGVFQQLDTSEEPIFIEPASADALPRMAMAVRAGAKVLGYLWVVVKRPFSAEQRRHLSDVTKVVAVHLLRQRAHQDAHLTLRAEEASSVLSGGSGSADAAARLGITDHKVCVLAAQATAGRDEQDSELRRRAVFDALTLHLGVVRPQAATSQVGEVVYALAPWRAAMPVTQARTESVRMAKDFVRRLQSRLDTNVAVGGVADSADQIPAAREEADRVLRVLRGRPGGGQIATLADVQLQSLLLELADVVHGQGRQLTGPVAELQRHDHEQHTDFVPTLQAYLDACGDVSKAAARVHVHPNTFRHRLRRLQTISGLDLRDPDALLQAHLHLRLAELTPEPHRTYLRHYWGRSRGW